MAKVGRKARHYETSWGEIIVGLSKRPSDGRWRIIGTQTTFAESDERRAVERFRALTQGETAEEQYRADSIERIVYSNQRGIMRWFSEQIRTRPLWVAEQTGIEQIGYLTDLRTPETLPTFDELETLFTTHYVKSSEEKQKILYAWRAFKDWGKLETLTQITPEKCIEYRETIYKDYKAKTQANRFAAIRRFFTFARQREIAPAALASVIDALKRLVPNDTALTCNPKPIEPLDFATLLATATTADKAMVLLMLNGAFYITEVIRLQWTDFTNGWIVTNRMKSGKIVRACVLWQETIDALAELRKTVTGERLFIGLNGLPIGAKGAKRRFAVLRDKAKLPLVTSSMLRDGAATAMAEAGVSERFVAIVLGHRSGIADHYIRRNAQMVAPASLAIWNKYFGTSQNVSK